jgi:hypothetical protein
MFMGLFIVVAGFDKAVLTPETISAATRLHLDRQRNVGSTANRLATACDYIAISMTYVFAVLF